MTVNGQKSWCRFSDNANDHFHAYHFVPILLTSNFLHTFLEKILVKRNKKKNQLFQVWK